MVRKTEKPNFAWTCLLGTSLRWLRTLELVLEAIPAQLPHSHDFSGLAANSFPMLSRYLLSLLYL